MSKFVRIGSAVCMAMPAFLYIGCAGIPVRNWNASLQVIAHDIIESTGTSGATVTVLPFRDAQGRGTQLGLLLSNALSEEIAKSGRFTTLDRGDYCSVVEEMRFGLTGATEQKTALRVGQILGARYLIVGTILNYGSDKIALQVRMLETETARLRAQSVVLVRLDRDMLSLNRLQSAANVDCSAAPPPAPMVTATSPAPLSAAASPLRIHSYIEPRRSPPGGQWSSGGFHVETLPIRMPEEGDWSATAVDSAGNVYVAYRAADSQGLGFVRRVRGRWSSPLIADKRDPTMMAIAVDRKGDADIVFSEEGTGAIRFIRSQGGRFPRPDVMLATSGGVPSIALDGRGYPRIAYGTYEDGSVYYRKWDGKAWAAPELVDQGYPRNGVWVSLAADGNGREALAYIHTGDISPGGGLNVARRYRGGDWKISQLVPYPEHADVPTVIFDRSGNEKIVFGVNSSRICAFIERRDGAWTDPQPFGFSDNCRNSAAVDASGRLHICYFSRPADTLRYAVYDGIQVHMQAVDPTGTPRYPIHSLGVDSKNRVHIVYIDQTEHVLRYVWKDGSSL